MSFVASHVATRTASAPTPAPIGYDLKPLANAERYALARNFHTETKMPSLDKVDELRLWHEKSGEASPSVSTIAAAKDWLRGLYCDVAMGGTWKEPNVTASENAEVVFEWWHRSKKLTVYVSEQGAEYIKVWGSDIFNEMEEGSVDNAQSRRKVWAWLMG